MSRLLHGIRQRWSERSHYRDWRDLLFATYNRVLIRLSGLPLPLRGRLYGFRLARLDRPVAVRLGTTDCHVMEELFFHGEYDPLFQRGLTSVRQVVDLGSNIGLSLRLWRSAFPEARILAVEPDEQNMSVCQFNARLEGNEAQCSFMQACVGALPGRVRLDRSGGEWGLRMSRSTEAGATEPLVESVTMAQLLAEQGIAEIDLLKCDIEGAEAEVFAACSEWIGSVRNMVVELHDPYGRDQFEADLVRNGGRFHIYHAERQGSHEVLFLEQPARDAL